MFQNGDLVVLNRNITILRNGRIVVFPQESFVIIFSKSTHQHFEYVGFVRGLFVLIKEKEIYFPSTRKI